MLYKNEDFVPTTINHIAIPRPASLVESLRAVGYDLPTAIADIIDNSIAAKASEIRLQFDWHGEQSSISISDNGTGMDKDGLLSAMTLGSINPRSKREESDLGRYGLGMKTASFSQCRLLQVISKKNIGDLSAMQWDLDYIAETGEWTLQELDSTMAVGAKLFADQGTVVTWNRLDRLTNGTKVESETDLAAYTRAIDGVKAHIAMTFHRFLEQPNRLKITLNGRKIESWDPFLRKEAATQHLASEVIPYAGTYVEVNAYVLPHHSMLTQEKHADGAGSGGWNQHQGFYVYRNNRLLVPGDWLGLNFQKEEHYKLARIRVDIPNSMDESWHIDIKKSKATPPSEIKDDLKRIAKATRQRASEIYRRRGKIIFRSMPKEVSLVWLRGESEGKAVYRLNRKHPVIAEILKSVDHKQIALLLKVVEGTVPYSSVVADWQENPMDAPLRKESQILLEKEIMKTAKDAVELLESRGNTREAAISVIATIEPFNEYPDILSVLGELA